MIFLFVLWTVYFTQDLQTKDQLAAPSCDAVKQEASIAHASQLPPSTVT